MSPFSETLLLNISLLAVAMSVLWLVSLPLRNVSIVDIFWGLGFILVAGASCWWSRNDSPRALLLLGLTIVWGARLAGYVFWRNHGHGEDRRYAAMRSAHGTRFWWISLFTVFLLQAVLLWVIALPLQAVAAAAPAVLFETAWDWFGMLLWAGGILFEVVGDAQLARFKADPTNHGNVMDRGLWRYTRHPNYFGECVLWWGIYFLSLPVAPTWTIVGPIVLTILLLKVSGVSLLEATIIERRPEYAEYQKRTNAFVPWYPCEMRQP